LKSDIDHHSSHEPFENPIHLSVASLDLFDHVVAGETPLELLEFRPSSALRQSVGYSLEFIFKVLYDANKVLGKRVFVA